MAFCGCCGGEEGRKESLFTDYAWIKEQETTEDTHRSIDLEQQINLHSTYREKRKKVQAEPLDLATEFTPPFFEKTKDQMDFLDSTLKENFLFDGLSDTERIKLMNAMQKQIVSKNTVIIREGQEDGDFFYVIEEGQVEFQSQGKTVGSTGRGGSFGELALLYNSPRAATCIAKSPTCTLWKVDQHTFRHVLARHAKEEEEEICNVLDKISLFDSFSHSCRVRIADALTKVSFQENERIVSKGDEGEVFYIIQSGTVKVHDIGLGDSQFVDQTLGPGDWFGERALLTGEPRAANVTAVSKDVTTLCLSRKTFEAINGRLSTVIERGMKKNFLLGIPLFAGSKFTSVEMDQILDILREECFAKGQKIAEIGKPYRQDLWIIRTGRILVVGKDGDIYNLKSGDYFGDKSLRAEEGRISSHDAIIEENTTCWVLSRKELEDVIGDIDRLSDEYIPFKSTMNRTIGLKQVQIHRILGMGAFGKVWLVSHKKDKTPYAMKMLDKWQLISSKHVNTVLREKTIMQSLNHPFLLGLISSFQDEYHLYLLLQLVQGGELFNVVHTDTTDGLPNDQACFYGACVLEALGYMHVRNICYRDLKPENVLIDDTGYCVVVDLGFAKIVVDKTFTLCGTPEYLAPEIIMSKGHDKAVDYWSYGVFLYELIVGKSPFYQKGSDQSGLFKRIVMVKYKMDSLLNDDAQDLIKQLLVRKQTDRLGNLSRGHRDIKDHAWFKDMDFKKLVRKELPAPWVPDIKDAFDSSHFGDFRFAERDHERYKTPLHKEQQALFKDF